MNELDAKSRQIERMQLCPNCGEEGLLEEHHVHHDPFREYDVRRCHNENCRTREYQVPGYASIGPRRVEVVRHD